MTQTITGISSMATRQILADIARAFEQRSEYKVAIKSMGGVEAAKIVRAGTEADVVILASPVMEQLETEGHLLQGSRQDVVRSGIAIAVRAGASKPAIDTEDAVKQAMLAADRNGFSTGPSGDHLKRLWARWRITDAMAHRAFQAPAGVPVAQLLVHGDVDLGFQQLSELLNVPGVEIVGPLPPAIQATTIFTAGIMRSSARIAVARDLLAFMASSETAAIKQRHGMDAADSGGSQN